MEFLVIYSQNENRADFNENFEVGMIIRKKTNL